MSEKKTVPPSYELIEEFDYSLPEELIASEPASPRHSSRLMILDGETEEISHHRFWELPQWLEEGDLLVRNDTKVIPARLFGHRKTGRKMEILLMYPQGEERYRWRALVKGGSRLKLPEKLIIEGNTEVEVEVQERCGEGVYTVAFPESTNMEPLLSEVGHMPLPPYLERQRDERLEEKDRESYQTVYATRPGAYAAPTAGLHFTSKVLGDLEARGVEIANITLHVGLGTFKPVQTDKISEHEMHREYYSIPEDTLTKLQNCRQRGGRILAVGTTTVRTLEAYRQTGEKEGWTGIFIYPPYEIESIDMLLTNFHLPQSTLLLLVSAFATWPLIQKAYAEAIREGYRFYSYGDAMLIK